QDRTQEADALELPDALDAADAAARDDDGGGERVAGRRQPDVALAPPVFVREQVGRAGGGDQLALAHPAIERNVLAEVQAARARRLHCGALGGVARLELLAAREPLLHALALAAHGVALQALRRRRARFRFDVDHLRLRARRRRRVRVVHRALVVHPAVDLGRGRRDHEQEEPNESAHFRRRSVRVAPLYSPALHAQWTASRVRNRRKAYATPWRRRSR